MPRPTTDSERCAALKQWPPMPPKKYLCHNPFEGEGSITNENGPKRRAQRTVHRQECDGVFCARNSLIGHYNPLRDVETLDGAPLPVAFAVHPNFPIVVDARLKQHSYTINRVPFHRFGQRDFDAIPSEGEPTGYPLRQVRGYLPAGIIVVRLAAPDCRQPLPPAPHWVAPAHSHGRISIGCGLPPVPRRLPRIELLLPS